MTTLTAHINRYKGDLVSTMRLSCAALSNKVIARTPVLSGSLRASWNITNGPPTPANVTISGSNPYGSRNQISQIVNSLMAGDDYSMANGQPYARRIEYEGWSANASAGMLRISVAEWQQLVDGSRQ